MNTLMLDTDNSQQATGETAIFRMQNAPCAPVQDMPDHQTSALHADMERAMSKHEVFDATQIQTLMTRYTADLSRRLASPFAHPGIFAWPDSLYVPSSTDYSVYARTQAPADHTFQHAWAFNQAPNMNTNRASSTKGELFAYVSANTNDKKLVSGAGLAAVVTPKPTLGYFELRAEIDVIAENRWWCNLGPTGRSIVNERGHLYLVVWQINTVTGEWEQLIPYTYRELFNRRYTGLGVEPIQKNQQHIIGKDFALQIQLQGAHHYAFGVVAQLDYDIDCTNNGGGVYDRTKDDVFTIWGAIQCNVRRMQLIPRTITIP